MQLRVFNLLKSWLSTAASDFQDNDALVDATADFALEIAAAVPGADATLHKLLAKRRTRKHDRQRTIVFSQPPPKSLVAAHGSAAQRVSWFKRGLSAGRMADCNTFEARNL